MKPSSYLVIVPAYNEEKNISYVINGIREYAPEVDILIVNDCSKDNTEKVAIENNCNVLTLCSNLGYSGALLTGMKYALLNGYNYVVQFDGDGQHDPREIMRLIEHSKSSGADIVIGSRFIERTNYHHGFFRKIGTFLFSNIIKLTTGRKITDPTSGLQILNAKTMRYYLESKNFPEYPDANILILMLRIGFKIEEIPVIMHDRLYGIGMHDSPVKNIKYIVSMLYSIFISVLKEKRLG
jgi:glycosyltransferase involved in cell wall biosynthesis